MKPFVEHGFIIVKPSGGVWDEYLYPSRDGAEQMAKLNSSLNVFPAKRVTYLRQTTTTTAALKTDLIIDRSNS